MPNTLPTSNTASHAPANPKGMGPVRGPLRTSLFAPLVLEPGAPLAPLATPGRASRGSVLAVEGETLRRVLVVRSGLLMLQRQGDDDSLVCVGVVPPGDGVVLLPGSGSFASPFTITALVDSEVEWLDVTSVRDCLLRHQNLSMWLIRVVVERTRELRRTVAFLHRAASAQEKVFEALRLVGQPCAQGLRVDPRIGQADLAAICGLSRSEVTRKIGELLREGAVARDSEGLLVPCLEEAELA